MQSRGRATAVYGDLTEEFSDADMISDWARPYVSALYALELCRVTKIIVSTLSIMLIEQKRLL